MKKLFVFTIFLALFVALAHSVLQMPVSCCTDAPAYNETTQYYIDNSLEDTGATNIIAAILADYRAFDTLGETIVLFTSIVAVVSVLGIHSKEDEGDEAHG